jgi:hypothetical protein
VSEDVKIISQNKIYLVFLGYAALLITMAFFYAPSVDELIAGFAYILTHPSVADFDGFAKVGNFGSIHLNTGRSTGLPTQKYPACGLPPQCCS